MDCIDPDCCDTSSPGAPLPITSGNHPGIVFSPAATLVSWQVGRVDTEDGSTRWGTVHVGTPSEFAEQVVDGRFARAGERERFALEAARAGSEWGHVRSSRSWEQGVNAGVSCFFARVVQSAMVRADTALAAAGLGPVVEAYWSGGGWQVSATDRTGDQPSPHHAPAWDAWVPALSGEGPYLLPRQIRARARGALYSGSGW